MSGNISRTQYTPRDAVSGMWPCLRLPLLSPVPASCSLNNLFHSRFFLCRHQFLGWRLLAFNQGAALAAKLGLRPVHPAALADGRTQLHRASGKYLDNFVQPVLPLSALALPESLRLAHQLNRLELGNDRLIYSLCAGDLFEPFYKAVFVALDRELVNRGPKPLEECLNSWLL